MGANAGGSKSQPCSLRRPPRKIRSRRRIFQPLMLQKFLKTTAFATWPGSHSPARVSIDAAPWGQLLSMLGTQGPLCPGVGSAEALGTETPQMRQPR
ncbi:hypothetical protein AB838_15345 [Rhodobacteraceae bacterium (ex Bugula neritina AB1)]|nr:hypothetical protein AB838_15345 [Rhodobacteraceae bacterium (ex Bugula neritina AB1)]